MAYQHTATDAFSAKMPGAGQVTAPTPFLSARRAVAVISGFFSGVMDVMVRVSERSSKMQQIEALQAKSDAELAQLGITRTDIPRHVLGAMWHI